MQLPSGFTNVTPVSKIIALLLFVALPFVGGYIGYTLGQNSKIPDTAYLKTDQATQPLISSSQEITPVLTKQLSNDSKLIHFESIFVSGDYPKEWGLVQKYGGNNTTDIGPILPFSFKICTGKTDTIQVIKNSKERIEVGVCTLADPDMSLNGVIKNTIPDSPSKEKTRFGVTGVVATFITQNQSGKQSIPIEIYKIDSKIVVMNRGDSILADEFEKYFKLLSSKKTPINSVSNTPSNWKIYSNNLHRFNFSYPDEWKMKEEIVTGDFTEVIFVNDKKNPMNVTLYYGEYDGHGGETYFDAKRNNRVVFPAGTADEFVFPNGNGYSGSNTPYIAERFINNGVVYVFEFNELTKLTEQEQKILSSLKIER